MCHFSRPKCRAQINRWTDGCEATGFCLRPCFGLKAAGSLVDSVGRRCLEDANPLKSGQLIIHLLK